MAAAAPITLRLPGRARPLSFTPGPGFASEAMRWSYVARNRDRWTAGTDPGQSERGPLQAYLDAAQLKAIADARLVEVGIPSGVHEAEHWPLRVFPWEYALSAATRGLRAGPLTVIRHLRADGSDGSAGAVKLQRPAVLQTAPGRLAQWYDTQAEAELMLSSLGVAQPGDTQCLPNPTRSAARSWLARRQPTLLHVAGVDTHQAVSLLGLEQAHPARTLKDGLVLRGTDSADGIDLVEAEDAAALLCAAASRPDLVLCNVYNSASRIAARCVAKGARYAIGYHDVIEDSLAALFCSTLYRLLASQGGDMLAAFDGAMKTLRAQSGQLRGACIVLWTRQSLLQAQPTAARTPVATRRTPARPVEPWQRIRVERSLKPQVNYALLHNRQSLFRTLQVFRDQDPGRIRDIQVTVDLNAGDGAFPFRTTFDLAEGENGRDLTHDVVLPLTSQLIRTQGERIQSSVRLLVSCEGRVVKEETFRVGLSPVDEWQDGDKDEWQWLPSFVLPRDAAVARIIDSAQGILCALADDPAAGFDGYQSIDDSAADEAGRYACVDKQVQAIWYALLNAHGLNYINPPPSYGSSTQRLRTPSQLLAERRGTCIDLALLLAACLEYVDIWPVLFLLRGHAFAGYWRSSELHARFLGMQGLERVFDGSAAARAAGNPASTGHSPGYVLAAGQHAEVRDRVYQGELVPLEATWLTQRGAFGSAVTEGRNNLRRAAEFQAMIDLRLARDRGVTPIPLIGSKAT